MPVNTFSIVIITIYKLVLYYFVNENKLDLLNASLVSRVNLLSGVQLMSTWHVTEVHLLQKFLDPQKHALIDSMWKPF